MSRPSFRSLLKFTAPLLLATFGLAGCGSGSGGVADTDGGGGGGVVVENPITVSDSFNFSAPFGEFTVGTPPIHARFLGGVANGNGAWIVKEGTTGTINFATPVDKVSFTAKDNYTAAAGAGTVASKPGNPGSQKFDVDVFVRGTELGWEAVADQKLIETSANVNEVTLPLTTASTGSAGEFKVADAGWAAVNCGANNDSDTITLGVAYQMACGTNPPNIKLEITQDGNYKFSVNSTDPTRPVITVSRVTSGGGGGGGGDPDPEPVDSAEIRIYARDVLNPGSAETLYKTVKGTGTIAVDETRMGGDTRITRIEVENLGVNGDLGIESITFTANPRFSPAAQPTDIFYRRPAGGYASTTINVNGTNYACRATTSNAFGCIVEDVPLYPYQMINLSVTNGAGAPETFVGNVGTGGQSAYAFQGVPTLRIGTPGQSGEPAAIPGANEIIVFYKRRADDYDGWGIHLFPKDPAGADWTTWGAPHPFEGIDPQYGAYFRVSLPQNATPPYSNNPPSLSQFPAVLGFILHNGDVKDPGPDQEVRIAQDGNMVFVTSGLNDVGTSPPFNTIVRPSNYAAHWVEADTVLYKAPAGTTRVEMLYSPDASLTNNVAGGFNGNFSTVVLGAGTNPQPPGQRDLATWPAYSLPASAVSNAQAIARSQIYIVAKNASGAVLAVTRTQNNGALDDLYAASADDAALGPTYSGGVPSLRVWAPTALLDPGVSVQLYNADGSTFGAPRPMTLDPATGVWSITGESDWDRKFYTFQLRVYTNSGDTIVANEVSDPYAVSGNTDGARSQFVNLEDPDLKPAGWDSLVKPDLKAPEDAVIYELHVRDFSIADPLVPVADRGKFTAFDVPGTNGRQHLQELADAGLTHVHILPAFDIATVLEDPAQRLDIDDSVQELCDRVTEAASLCFNPANGSKKIRDLMAEYAAQDPASLEPQRIVNWIRALDGFNWGYDPYHFGSPEGSYSTNPNGAQRVLDFRRMVKGLAENGLLTVMDVVYNHTNAEGQADKSVFDKIVPGYYHRRDRTSGAVTRSTCCSDIATEFKMAEKVMFDTGLRFVEQYKVDGFRFDLMTSHTKEQMVRFTEAVQAVNEDVYVYGEGWNSGPGQDDKQYVSARQDNMAGTGIGTFNDRIRDAVRGGGPFDSGASLVSNQGIISGLWYDPNAVNSGAETERARLLEQADRLRAQLAGGVKSYTFQNRTGATVAGSTAGAYVEDPSELINYIEKHDNETLWDISQYKHPFGTPTAARVRAQNVGASMVLLAQGIPFIQAGQDFLRSKSTDRNSYDSGDWYNELDWTLATSKWGIGLPPQGDNLNSRVQATAVLGDVTAESSAADREFASEVFKEFLEIRKSSELFRLRTPDQIKARLTMFNTGPNQQPGVVAYRLDGCSSPDLAQNPYGAIVTIFNATDDWTQLREYQDESFTLHPVQAGGVDATVKQATHDAANGFRVPPRTTAVFVRAAQSSCSPYGVPIFVRGLGGDWTANPLRELSYVGGTSYSRTIAVAAGAQQFKIADNDWTPASNCGAATDGVNVAIGAPLQLVCNNDSKNLNFSPPAAGDYTFALEAANKAAPVLTVGKAAPFGSTTLFVRGGFNDWGNGPSPTAPMTWDNLGTYRAEVMGIAAGTYEFKVADAGWTATSDCGRAASAPPAITLGEPLALNCNQGGNIGLTIPTTGSYLFAIDGSNPAALTITVEKMPFAAAMYVRGFAEDWSAAASNRMSYLGGGIYRKAQTFASAGNDNFKIADADWTSGSDCGASGATLNVGTPLTFACTGPNNGDVNFAVPAAGRYVFTMNATNPAAPEVSVTGP